MEITRINEDLIDIGGKVRVERGPAKRTGKATEALLDNDKTAPHYKVGTLDADGKVIEAGKSFTYLDWLGTKGWYVYALGDGVPVEDSFHEDEAAAVARGTTLASA
jgi:hypothetical protein